MNLGLKGKCAVITGASKGIGRSIALALADEGVDVAICARGEEALRITEKEIIGKGVKVYAGSCDVGDKQELNDFLEASRRELGSVDILVNNVSALSLGENEIDWAASINLDLMAGVKATMKVIPWMIESGSGSILFISSISGLESGSPSAYAALKAAVISYSKTLSAQLAPKNIRVNTITPGSIEFSGGAWENVKKQNPAMYEYVRSTIPSGRMGTPEEVGNVAAFLASPRASWITGACISVDGGQHKFNL